MKQIVLGIALLAFTAFNINAADIYWVGGTGNWSDSTNHWSFTSGGAPGATLPKKGDNVYFDALSGLSGVADIVTIDTIILTDSLDFSALTNSFTMDAAVTDNHFVYGSIIGSTNGINFTGTWGEIRMDAELTGQTILSGAIVWSQDFRIVGLEIALLDDFNTATKNLYIDSTGFNTNGFTLTLGSFYSTSIATRTFNFNNSTIIVSNGIWEVDGTNLTSTYLNSEIQMGNTAGTASFIGGSQDYGILRSTSATTTEITNDNTFKLLEFSPSTILSIGNGDNLSTDSLIASGNCTNSFTIQAINAGVPATITKTGTPIFYLTNISVDNVNALGAVTYNIGTSEVLSGTGWTLAGAKFFWISDSGDWNDLNQWSNTSGGPVSGCLPTILDSVFFDNNSFSSANQTVVIDDSAYAGYIDWSAVTTAQTMRIDSSLVVHGDIVLNGNLNVTRGALSSSFILKDDVALTTSGATMDCNVIVYMNDPTSIFLMNDDFVATETSGILFFNGVINTAGNYLRMGSIFTADIPSALDQRTINFGNSKIDLSKDFNANGDAGLTIIPGTSHLTIGSPLGLTNDLITTGKNFYDVTLNFTPNTQAQTVKGNNNFNKLIIPAGSSIYFEQGATQTIADSLVAQGNCRDSIFIYSLDTVGLTPANFNKVGTGVLAECLNVSGITNTGNQLTALFSTDVTSNTNWNFDPTPPVTASFTSSAPVCKDDTVSFTNNSVGYSGDANDITNYWYFKDGSTGYFVNPPTDSTFIDYEIDTLKHAFIGFGNFNVVLEAEYKNFCSSFDTVLVEVVVPNIALFSTVTDSIVCPNTPVTFKANSPEPNTQFEFFYNGVSQNTPSVNDTLFTLNSILQGDSISLKGFREGCPVDFFPNYKYDLYEAINYTWGNNSIGEEICKNDTVVFTATSLDSLNNFQFLVNNSSVSGILDSIANYSTKLLNNGDQVSLITIDTNSCRDTTSITFTVNALPNTSLAESSGGTVICENEAVTFTANNGALFEFYINDTLVQGPLATNTWLVDSLTATDVVSASSISADGCRNEAPSTFNYIINEAPALSLLSSDTDNTICTGETVDFTATGAGIYEFFIDGISVQGPSPSSTYSSNSLADNEVVSVQGNISGCNGNEPSLLFTVNNAPTTTLVNDDADNTICQGTSVIFTASGANTYEFLIDGISQGTASAVNTLTSNTIQNGQTIEVIGESNGCQVNAINTFSVLSKPNVGIVSNDANNIICNGENISFIGSSASNYEFFVNNTSVQGPLSNSVLANPSLNVGANDVFLIGTANNGCTDTSQVISVQNNPIPTLLVSSSDVDNTICAGESVTFTATGGDNYQFILNGTPQTSMTTSNTFTTTALTNGQIMKVNGRLNGCSSVSNTITTVVNPSPTIALTSSDVDLVFCEDETVTFTANGAATYQFFVDGVSQGPLSATSSINSTGFVVGNYDVRVDGEASNCTSSSNINITVNGVPNVSLVSSDADNSICSGETVVYTATGVNLYEFFINGTSQGASSPSNTIQFNNLNDNDVVSVIGASAVGCKNNNVLPSIEVLPNPIVNITSTDVDQQICRNEAVTFNASGASTYQFSVNGIAQGVPSATDNITLSTLNNGDVVQVNGYTSGCSSLSNSLNFQVFNFPIVNLTNIEDTVLCSDELTNLTSTGADQYLYSINGNPVGTFSPTNTLNSILNDGDVVTVEGQTNGCSSISSTDIAYSVFNYPTITATASDTDLEICLNDTVLFTATGADRYEYALNGLQIGTNTTGIFETDQISNADIFTVVGLNAHCASADSDFNFIVNEMTLSIATSPSNMICEGDNFQATAAGADEYEFLLNGTSAGSPSTTNTYSNSTIAHHDQLNFIGYNNTTGCAQRFNDYIIMNVLESPVITPLSNTSFCEGDSVVLVSNATYGNSWLMNGNPVGVDTFLVADTSGSFSLEVTMGGMNDLWSMGQNAYGVFANGNSFNSSIPLASNSSIQFTEISAGYNFVAGIDNSKALFTWGNNATGQLGNGTYTSSTLPIQVGTLTDIKTVATGSNSVMATTELGGVYVWGNNVHGQLGTGNTSIINFPFLNTNLTDIDTIAAGRSHYILLKNDGTVQTVGNNDYGQLGNGTLIGSSSVVTLPLTNIVAVGANEYSSFAINNIGEMYVWGNNATGQLGMGDLTNRLTPTLSDLKGVTNVQGGANHTVFLTNDNSVYTSGGNSYGQLGNSTQTKSLLPKKLDIQGVNMIAAGEYSTLLKRTDNSVFVCGNNTENQLSAISDTAITTLTFMAELEGVTFIESSQNASHFLYGQNITCISTPVVTTFSVSPVVEVIASGDILSTDQPGAASYQWYFNGNVIPGATSGTYTANSSGNYSVEAFYVNGCSSISAAYYHSLVGLPKDNAISLILYPNPTNNVLNIEFNQAIGNVKITIVDNIGKIVKVIEENSNEISIQCQDLENGVYYVQVASQYGNSIERFVVNH